MESTQPFKPCASTRNYLLYAHGSTIQCLNHDTLEHHLTFQGHQQTINLISVDNAFHKDLVVSYDAENVAIVWNVHTGAVVTSFVREGLTVAAWRPDGNLSFGTLKGEIILFPVGLKSRIRETTFDTEHSNSITALAPAADHRTYAIGYQDGSFWIANIDSKFTRLFPKHHSPGPSPIASLAWHASSSKQKSDMLAVQSSNGELRVWSVSKPPTKEAPRAIRTLKRNEYGASGPTWIAWSKNGKVVQYLNGEIWSWDVRTKQVDYESIPTMDGVRGIANYGATAALFTLGPHNIVRQYDVGSQGDPVSVVAEVQLPLTIPRQGTTEGHQFPRPLHGLSNNHESETPLTATQTSFTPQFKMPSRNRMDSVSSTNSSGSHANRPFSPARRSEQGQTDFSMTPDTSQTSHSFSSSPSITMPHGRMRAGSRLRNEIQPSPVDREIMNLFPFTRARLKNVHSFRQPFATGTSLTPSERQQQMLEVVFGWDGTIQELITDELRHHALDSQSAILLTIWLRETDTDNMAAMISSGQVTAFDWMLLALSQMKGQEQANKVGQAFVQKLLQIGDIHTSAAVLFGLGDHNDAVEVYVSRNLFMEAILMTSLLSDWQRVSYLLELWGQQLSQDAQQRQLAERCLMCTGVELSESWASPPAQRDTFFGAPISSQDYDSGLMPAPIQIASASNQKTLAKTPALKLITSFTSNRIPGVRTDDRTPTNGSAITPIAESAIPGSAMTPGGFGSYRLNNIQSLNNAMARSNTPPARRRLPSIGEMSVEVVRPPLFPMATTPNPSENNSTSENEMSGRHQNQEENTSNGLLILSSARYDPSTDSQMLSPQTAVQGKDKFASIKGLPSPAVGVFDNLTYDDERDGSRDRKPEGLHLELLGSGKYNPDGLAGIPSAKSTSSTIISHSSTKSPTVSGRNIDQYINSLDEANFHARKFLPETPTRTRQLDEPVNLRSRTQGPDFDGDNPGRGDGRYTQPAKFSPASPICMSPEDYRREAPSGDRKPKSRTRSSSQLRTPGSRSRRSNSRQTPDRVALDAATRGRRDDRNVSSDRSVSSPPLEAFPEVSSSQAAHDPLRLVESNQRRLRSRQRSASRRHAERDTSRRRAGSPESRHKTSHSISVLQPESSSTGSLSQRPEILSNKVYGQEDVFYGPSSGQLSSGQLSSSQPSTSQPSSGSSYLENTPTTPLVSATEQKRRDFAAELEARRLSLARKPSAPNIPSPGSLRSPAELSSSSQSQVSQEYSSSGSSVTDRKLPFPITPRAMRHPKYGDTSQDEERPSVPRIPMDTGHFLTNARYQGDADRMGRSISGQSSSVPSDVPMHPRFNRSLPRSRSNSGTRNTIGHRRRSSGGYAPGNSPNVQVKIEEEIDKAMLRSSTTSPPARISALQHLLGPPPPPPPPFAAPATSDSPRDSAKTIDIGVDDPDSLDSGNLGLLLPRAMTAAPALNTSHNRSESRGTGRRMSFDHRRNNSSNESFTNKLRNLARKKSTEPQSGDLGTSPQESTSLPPYYTGSLDNYMLPGGTYVPPGTNFI